MKLQLHPNPIIALIIGLNGHAGLAEAADVTGSSRPNVVVILADDQGWGDLSLNGNTNLATPNIDSLARDGARFEHFYVSPVCSPTRAEFLTGRYHPRGGVHGTSAGGERLDLDEHTVAEAFKAAGYATGAFGKWHNGSQGPYHPNARGFEEFYGFCSGHWGHYFSPMLEHNGEIMTGNGFLADDLTEHAMAFIEANHAKRPFFVYLPYNIPHSPMQVPERFYAKFADAPVTLRNRDPDQEEVAFTRAALALCENVDWNVGRVLGLLKDLGAARETIVIYFSDNGPNSWRWNGGMKGRKGSTDWSTPADRIRFDVEVLRTGRYEAVLYYACPAADVGSTIELTFGTASVRGVLPAPHDPPLVGAEEDRVPRGESYVKDFKPWRLGELDLPAGRGDVVLRAVEIPGRQAMEFRLLTLRLLP